MASFSQTATDLSPRGTGGCVPSPSGFVLRIAPARYISPTLWCRVAPLLPAGWAIPAKSSGRWTGKEAMAGGIYSIFRNNFDKTGSTGGKHHREADDF